MDSSTISGSASGNGTFLTGSNSYLRGDDNDTATQSTVGSSHQRDETSAAIAAAGSGGDRGQPAATTTHNKLFFSDCTDPAVLFDEASRLRVQCEEQRTYLELLQREYEGAVEDGNTMRGLLITAHAQQLPKLDIAAFRKELDQLKADNAGLVEEGRTATSRNVALTAETARLREAFLSKEILLASRARALERRDEEAAEHAQRAAELEETARREADLRARAEQHAEAHARALAAAKQAEGRAGDAAETLRAEREGLAERVRALERENEQLRGRVRRVTEGAVARETFDSFDDSRAEMEAAFLARTRELEARVRELTEEAELQRRRGVADTAAAPVAALRREAERHRHHAEAAAAKALGARQAALVYKEEVFRLRVEREWAEGTAGGEVAEAWRALPKKDMVEMLDAHAETYRALAKQIRKRHAVLKRQLLEKVKPVVDKAYQDGHSAGLEAARRRRGGSRRGTPRQSAADSGGDSDSGEGERVQAPPASAAAAAEETVASSLVRSPRAADTSAELADPVAAYQSGAVTDPAQLFDVCSCDTALFASKKCLAHPPAHSISSAPHPSRKSPQCCRSMA